MTTRTVQNFFNNACFKLTDLVFIFLEIRLQEGDETEEMGNPNHEAVLVFHWFTNWSSGWFSFVFAPILSRNSQLYNTKQNSVFIKWHPLTKSQNYKIGNRRSRLQYLLISTWYLQDLYISWQTRGKPRKGVNNRTGSWNIRGSLSEA